MNFKQVTFLWVFSFLSFIGSFCYAGGDHWSDAQDFLEQAFGASLSSDFVVGYGVGNNKQQVWNYLLKWWTTITLWSGKTTTDSLLVSATKLLLRITFLLSITMIIYNGIFYVIKSSKGEGGKDALNNILYVVVWIVLALSSVIIIRLAYSAWSTIANGVDSGSYTSYLIDQSILHYLS